MDRPTPLTGEHLALDLVNTRPAGHDVLLDPVGAHAWLVTQADRLPHPAGPLSDSDAAGLRAVRAYVEAALLPAVRGDRPPKATLVALTLAQRDAPGHDELGWDGTRVTVTPRREGPYLAQLLATLAAAAGDLLSGPELGRIRQCQGPDCTLLFIPANPRRRWCSPAVCGNRVRVARYYQRHKLPS
ncbi:CGNR zinc finger domain-containing protein [Longispora sp. NPDC051575]|uniref:CGNR zinc finger domain-containing protein n=1 Tax=Longispora sp. NPDC051575 TaxID=3154943 RepID=UPI0034439D87